MVSSLRELYELVMGHVLFGGGRDGRTSTGNDPGNTLPEAVRELENIVAAVLGSKPVS